MVEIEAQGPDGGMGKAVWGQACGNGGVGMGPWELQCGGGATRIAVWEDGEIELWWQVGEAC